MPNPNPTIHNYLNESIEFNKTTPNLSITAVPHGADATVEFAHIPTFPIDFNFSGSFAIHAWIKADATCSIHSRIINTPAWGVEEVTNAFAFGLLGNDTFYGTANNALRIGMGVDPSGTQNVKVTCLPVLRPDNWHHVVGQLVVGEPNTIEIYIDGCKADLIDHADLDYSLTTNTGGTDATGLVVGWDPDLDGPFKGNIASIAVFNRDLTPDEIETLAQGTINLTGVSQNLKSSLVSWWKMGDNDTTNLTTLNDSVGTNHLTTINMTESNRLTDNPPEMPRQHQNLHISTGCDEIKLDPNGVGCPFLWDSFPTLDNPDSIPRGWFGDKNAADKFERVMIAGRLSVLRLAKNSSNDEMYMTNLPTDATGETLLFGNPSHPDPTEYCFETVVRNGGAGGENPNDNLYMGFVASPHTFTAQPDTGVYFHWHGSGNSIRIIISDSGNSVATSILTLSNTIFYRLKLCFTYCPNVPYTGGMLSAKLYVNDILQRTLDVLSTDIEYPTGNGNIFIGIDTDSAPQNIDISWVNVSFRGIGANDVLAI